MQRLFLERRSVAALRAPSVSTASTASTLSMPVGHRLDSWLSALGSQLSTLGLRLSGWAERETGLEPATPSLEGLCSSQLSYSRAFPAHVSRIAVRIPTRNGPASDPFRGVRFVSFPCRTPAFARARGGWSICGGEGRIRTSVGMSQQIYSLPRLTASVPLQVQAGVLSTFARDTLPGDPSSFIPRSVRWARSTSTLYSLRAERTKPAVTNAPTRSTLGCFIEPALWLASMRRREGRHSNVRESPSTPWNLICLCLSSISRPLRPPSPLRLRLIAVLPAVSLRRFARRARLVRVASCGPCASDRARARPAPSPDT